MGLPSLEPIRDEDLPAFCRFLAENLSRERTPEAWAEAFRQPWSASKPNNGFMLRDQGRIVGGIGAIYSERVIRGNPERFCNITSWCVLEPYRAQSMRLAMAVTTQAGFHYTDLTPTEVVSKTLQFLKFKPMDERQAVWPNLPSPFARIAGVRVVTGHDRIEAVLAREDARVFRDHRHLHWLRHVAVGRPGRYCHVVWKPDRLRRVPGARILAFSDADAFLDYRFALAGYFLRHGCLYSRTESRLLPRLPIPCLQLSGFRKKVFRSDALGEADISNLYSEIVGLDL